MLDDIIPAYLGIELNVSGNISYFSFMSYYGHAAPPSVIVHPALTSAFLYASPVAVEYCDPPK